MNRGCVDCGQRLHQDCFDCHDCPSAAAKTGAAEEARANVERLQKKATAEAEAEEARRIAAAAEEEKRITVERKAEEEKAVAAELCKLSKEEKDRQLIETAKKGDPTRTQLLIEARGDVNACDGFGHTPLWMASEFGRLEVVTRLLAANAAINQFTHSGQTPLIAAVGHARPEIVKALLNAKADMALADANGTALANARKGMYAEIVRLLEAEGAPE